MTPNERDVILRRLARLRDAANAAIHMVEVGRVVDDPIGEIRAPWDFRVGDFLVTDCQKSTCQPPGK